MSPHLATAMVAVTVQPVNDPPTAANDAFGVVEGSMNTSLDVLRNDTAAPDVGETLVVTSVTVPMNGTASVSPGGTSVRYTPNAGYNGPDEFSYTVLDPGGLTATAQVQMTVGPANDPPVNAVPMPQTVAEDATLAFTAPNTFSVSDPDAVNQPIQVCVAFRCGGKTTAASDSEALIVTGAALRRRPTRGSPTALRSTCSPRASTASRREACSRETGARASSRAR